MRDRESETERDRATERKKEKEGVREREIKRAKERQARCGENKQKTLSSTLFSLSLSLLLLTSPPFFLTWTASTSPKNKTEKGKEDKG